MNDKILYYFISTGSEHKMFTLRYMYIHTIYIKGIPSNQIRSQYIRNLSTDIELAIEKLKGFAIAAGHSFRLSPEIKDTTLCDITRLTAAELDHRKWEEHRAMEERKLQAEVNQKELHDAAIEAAEKLNGSVSFGKYQYAEMTLKELIKRDPDYVRYLFSTNEMPIKYPLRVMDVQLNTLWDLKAALPKKKKSKHVGEKGDKVELKLRVKLKRQIENHRSRSYDSMYIFIDDKTGCEFKAIYSGYTWDLDEGDTEVMIATIKDHGEYEGVKQTILTRMKPQK